MHRFTVVEVVNQSPGPALWLADTTGRYHVARATAGVPRVGARLLGNAPAIGFALLLGTPMDQVFRVVFEAVHCTLEQAEHSMDGRITL